MSLAHPILCISVCESDWPSAARALSKVGTQDALVEIRVDCLGPEDLKNLDPLRGILAASSHPTIVTFRPTAEGGHSNSDKETRLRFWRDKGLQRASSFIDLEFEIAEQLRSGGDDIDWSRVICSYHNPAELPGDLNQIFERLATTPAHVIKIAVHINDAVDCLPIFQLLDHASQLGREIIAIGMGPAGVATRILGPARGAFLTYASPENGPATAAGQVSLAELTSVYRIEAITRETVITGLVGCPVGHSISPQIHNAAFASLAADAVYIPLEVRDLKAFCKRMVHPRTREIDWRMRGLSITAPHKTAVLSELNWIETGAREIGAVNTVVVEDDRLCGYNTDAGAFLEPLKDRLGSLKGSRVAVLGAGGAASAALYSLKQENAKTTIFARDMSKGKQLAERWSSECRELREALFAEFDVVVNATPLGTKGPQENQTAAEARQLRGARLAYDLVYNPQMTQFLSEARAAGCETLDGLPMLLNQAAQQIKLWTGQAANSEVMKIAASRALRNSSW